MNVFEGAKLIEAVYDRDMMGGTLHVVIDDDNLDDDCLDWKDWMGPDNAAEASCRVWLQAATMRQREAALFLAKAHLRWLARCDT